MKYKAEIFDKFQYLYDVTGYSDHQVHCVIHFNGKANAEVMERAAYLLIKAVPILSRTYIDLGKSSYWEDADPSDWDDLFTITGNREDFDRFTNSKTNQKTGPQIKFCLLQGANDSLSVVINHMVSDGAGFKQCMYLFSEIYSKLLNNPDYTPDYVVDGERGFKSIAREQGVMHRLGLLFINRRDNNQKSTFEFPMVESEIVSPFIVSRELSQDLFQNLKSCCRSTSTTAAYFRALSEMLGIKGRELSIPIMIDMRRYLKDKSFRALTNLASTTIVKAAVLPDENFETTLAKISSIMNKKKSGKLGMNTFLKLDAGFRIPFVNAYGIMGKTLRHPKIAMTNIGIIDATRLSFADLPVKNALMFASIKYRPHIQLSVTSFEDKITFGIGLYGSEQDRERIKNLLDYLDAELKSAGGA
ncbi:MAG: hypothetical protein CVU91_00025 [Firmicutes bacterium HGW-Firmicutes-16]|nr:MAG: hypothetical protein CVU91_00025 [Firmicutes bacterium HGW-Firmicutes-16]